MVHKLSEPTERHHVHLYKRDCRRIETFFSPRIKFNTAVRELIRQMLDRIEAQAKARHQALPDLSIPTDAEIEVDV